MFGTPVDACLLAGTYVRHVADNNEGNRQPPQEEDADMD